MGVVHSNTEDKKVEKLKSYVTKTAMIHVEAIGYPKTKTYHVELYDAFMDFGCFYADDLNNKQLDEIIKFHQHCLCHRFEEKTSTRWKMIYTSLPFEISYKRGEEHFATIYASAYREGTNIVEKSMDLNAPWGYANLSLM